MREALVRAERIGHRGQRLVERCREQRLVGHVVGHLAQPVHVVGEADEARLALSFGQHLEGVANHAGARHLAESTDVRQARGAVAGFENDGLVLAARQPLQPLDETARLLERPSLGVGEGGGEKRVGWRCHGIASRG